MFCSPFDQHLAMNGPPAVFLVDAGGELRFDADWTRDAWERAAAPVEEHRWAWTLLRDRATGFVWLGLFTSPSLVPSAHPRIDARVYADRISAEAARDALGRPPIAETAWS